MPLSVLHVSVWPIRGRRVDLRRCSLQTSTHPLYHRPRSTQLKTRIFSKRHQTKDEIVSGEYNSALIMVERSRRVVLFSSQERAFRLSIKRKPGKIFDGYLGRKEEHMNVCWSKKETIQLSGGRTTSSLPGILVSLCLEHRTRCLYQTSSANLCQWN